MRREMESRFETELQRESDKKSRRGDQTERQQLDRLTLERRRLADNGGDAANNERLLREHDATVAKLKDEWAESKRTADDKLRKRLASRKRQLASKNNLQYSFLYMYIYIILITTFNFKCVVHQFFIFSNP